MRGTLLNGPQMVRAAQNLQEKRQHEEWPYVHVFPPPNSIPLHQIAATTGPAAGSTGIVLSYTVPMGMRAFLQSILQVPFGGAFNPGDALWTVYDGRVSVASSQAMAVQGLQGVPVPLGSITAGTRWVLERAYEFAADHIITSVVQNVSFPGVGFVSGFFGYLVPDL